MKKRTTRILALIIVLLLSATFVINAFAETIYEYYGLRYTLINNYSVSIYGRTEDSSVEVVIPAAIYDRTVDEIANRAFLNDTELTGVDFSVANNLKYIGMFAFKGCTSLNGDLVLPESITYIDTAAFQECTSLASVTINAMISAVRSQMFYQCNSLSNVYLNNNIKSIESYAFANCPSLTYIEIPQSVESIANSAFQNDQITLGVYYNSYAHQYAMDKDIEFVILDPENIPSEPPTEPPTEPEPEGYLLGDTDDNGDVEVVDATWLQRYIALMNIGVIEDTVMQGDVDGDGDPSIVDAAFIMRYCVGIETPFDIGEFVELS